MSQREKQLVNAPVSWMLTGKIEAIKDSFDVLVELEAAVMEPGRSTSRETRRLADTLAAYKLGLPTNMMIRCKPILYLADGIVCELLSQLYRTRCADMDDVQAVEYGLEHALEGLLEVYAIEEARSRVYKRIGSPRPNYSKRPEKQHLPYSYEDN